MPSIRLSAVHVLILASLPLAGCSYSRDAYLPAGTEAVVSDSDTGGVTAFVPPNQQNKVPRDSIILGNETPVVVVCVAVRSFSPNVALGSKGLAS